MNMSIVHIGKDTTDYQNNSVEEQAANLTCEIELTDADLKFIYGGGLVGGLPLVGGLVGGLPLVGGLVGAPQGQGH